MLTADSDARIVQSRLPASFHRSDDAFSLRENGRVNLHSRRGGSAYADEGIQVGRLSGFGRAAKMAR